MLTQDEKGAIIGKTRELCQTILTQPAMVSARQRIDAFLADDAARTQYQNLVSKGQALREKQEQSASLSDEEVAEFESHRESVLKNPVSNGFLAAQEDLHEIRHSITKLISMALESGQVPSEEDFQQATCGHGCNCH